jgi:hypothetical protein
MAQRRDSRQLMMIGRLPDGADLASVRAELTQIAANIAVAHPDTNKDVRPLVNTLLEAYNGGGEMRLGNSTIYMPLLATAFVRGSVPAQFPRAGRLEGSSEPRDMTGATRSASGAYGALLSACSTSSMSALVCAALIWNRIVSSPRGTTG